MKGVKTNVAGYFEFLFLFSSLASFVRQTASSKCVVGKWQEWSECQGNCEFAQRVRNRDVIRPPFPERDELTGEFFIRECPPLYEVEQCIFHGCGDESPFAKLPASILKRIPSRPSKGGELSEELPIEARIKNNNNNGTRRAEPKTKAKRIETPIKQQQQQQEGPRSKVAGIGIHSDDSGSQLRKNQQNSQTRVADCSHQNKSCCRVVRASCGNGGRPRQLIRWYRKKDEQFCRPYKYSFCDDLFERVFATENECLDSCFSEVEKAVLPNFRVI